MKKLAMLAVCVAAPLLYAGESTVEAAFRVSGVCTMCEKRIERAVAIEAVSSADWNRRTQMLALVYDSSAVTLDSLQRRVAAAGHDTERHRAPDSLYASLPGCCLYRGEARPH